MDKTVFRVIPTYEEAEIEGCIERKDDSSLPVKVEDLVASKFQTDSLTAFTLLVVLQ